MFVPNEGIVRTATGGLDVDHYREKALAERSAMMRELAPAASATTKRRLLTFGLAVALATGAFWATMLTAPPITKAAPPGSVDVVSVDRIPPGVIPEFDATYQRRIGVLDPS